MILLQISGFSSLIYRDCTSTGSPCRARYLNHVFSISVRILATHIYGTRAPPKLAFSGQTISLLKRSIYLLWARHIHICGQPNPREECRATTNDKISSIELEAIIVSVDDSFDVMVYPTKSGHSHS
jgi:hypothetical protein